MMELTALTFKCIDTVQQLWMSRFYWKQVKLPGTNYQTDYGFTLKTLSKCMWN